MTNEPLMVLEKKIENTSENITKNILSPNEKENERIIEEKKKRSLKYSAIYSITNIVNSKKYIGSSYDYMERWRNHKSLLKRNKHPNIHLQSAWNKYGETAFIFEIIEKPLFENLIVAEQKYLDIINKEKDKYYNIAINAERTQLGRKLPPHTEEWKAYMSKKMSGKIGKPWSEKTKQLQIQSHIGQKAWNKDKKLYIIKNKETGEIFKATRDEMKNKLRIKKSRLIRLLHGNKTTRHWELVSITEA